MIAALPEFLAATSYTHKALRVGVHEIIVEIVVECARYMYTFLVVSFSLKFHVWDIYI